MKRTFSMVTKAFVISSIFSSQLFSQSNQVSTPVVGFTSTAIPGKVSGQSQFFTIIPTNLQKNPVYGGTGTATGTTITPSNFSVTSGALNASTFPTHYLIFTSGANVGLTTDIISNSATTISTADNVSASINAGDRFEIIPHIKVTDVLGASGSQIIASGSGASSADNVYLVGTNGSFQAYYYKSAPGAGFKTSGNADATGLIVYPGEALLVGRKAGTATVSNAIVTGRVADHSTVVPISQGFNVTGGGAPVSITLGQLTSLVGQGANLGSADNVLWVDPADGQLKNYYYKTAPGAGWKNSANQNVSSNTVLASGFVIQRKNPGSTNLTTTKAW
jgi:hypothetical protein